MIASIGANGSADADNLIVLESTLSGAGTKALYLENLSGSEDLTRTQPTTNTSVTIGNGASTDIDLTPSLARSLTLGAGEFNIFLWVNADNNGARSINAQLRYFGASSGVIDDFSQYLSLGNSLATATRIPFTLSIPADLTLLPGTQLRLRVTNQSAGGGYDIIINSFKSGDPDPYSIINLNSNTVISVDSVTVYDAAHDGLTEAGGGTLISELDPPGNIYIRAKISNPFGSFDINPNCAPPANCPAIDIDDSTTLVEDDTSMSSQVYEDISAGFRIYEFMYSVPGAADGTHTFTVTGTEGEEATITDTGLTTLTVGIPDLSVTKDTDTGVLEFNSSDPVQYKIVITNDGTGTATNIVLTDELDELLGLNLEGYGPGVIFQLDATNCVTCSLCAERFTEDGGAQWAYVPGPTGIDTSVIEWEFIINGEMDALETIILRYWTEID